MSLKKVLAIYSDLNIVLLLIQQSNLLTLKIISGLFVLIVRENFCGTNNIKFILNKLSEYSVDTLLQRKLSYNEIEAFTNKVRGGVWPEIEGGKPSYIISGFFTQFDVLQFTNEFKNIVRKHFRKPGSFPVSVLHSSDNEHLAYHHLSLLESSDANFLNQFLK